MTTVLVTSAGGGHALNVINALREDKSIIIVAADAYKWSSGLFLADKHGYLPIAESPGYIKSLIDLYHLHKVDVLIPIHSRELPVIAANISELHNAGVNCLVSDSNIIKTFNDKWHAAQYFKSCGISHPTTSITSLPAPVVTKPRVGSGSTGFGVMHGKNRICQQGYILQEYVEGVEYTVDVLFDDHSALLGMLIRERVKVVNGAATVVRSSNDERIRQFILDIVPKLSIKGPANIQIIVAKDQIYVIEINTRFAAGGLPLATHLGINMPLMLVNLLMGKHIEPKIQYKSNEVMIRYMTEVFRDDSI